MPKFVATVEQRIPGAVYTPHKYIDVVAKDAEAALAIARERIRHQKDLSIVGIAGAVCAAPAMPTPTTHTYQIIEGDSVVALIEATGPGDALALFMHRFRARRVEGLPERDNAE